MFQILIISLLISLLGIIIMRCYDKFNNKQYMRNDYIKQFILLYSSSIIILYIDKHFSNFNKLQKGGNYNIEFNNNNNNNNKAELSNNKSFIENGLHKFKMNFETGTPNF